MLPLGTVPEWCATTATFASLKYLIDYAKAAKKQVDVSPCQVHISEKQVDISQEQIRVSQEQIRVSQAQARIAEQHMLEQMRPILVMTALETGEDDTARFTIQNQGGRRGLRYPVGIAIVLQRAAADGSSLCSRPKRTTDRPDPFRAGDENCPLV